MYSLKQAWSGFILSLFILVPMMWLFLSDGSITIEKPYYNEYQDCKLQVSELQKSVQCPETKCNCGASGIVWTIMGGLFGLSGYAMYWYSLKKAERLQEETKPKTTRKP